MAAARNNSNLSPLDRKPVVGLFGRCGGGGDVFQEIRDISSDMPGSSMRTSMGNIRTLVLCCRVLVVLLAQMLRDCTRELGFSGPGR